MTLEVLIATHGTEGILRVAAMQLPQMDGVTYTVSWQECGSAPVPPSLSGREDVGILRFDRSGLSANRNNLLEHATGDILLMSDDDLIYTPGQLMAVRDTFASHPEVDFAVFRHDGTAPGNRPDHEFDIDISAKGLSAACFDIALRRESDAGRLRFDHRFGPGSELLRAAEDEVFILDSCLSGIRGRYFPVSICTHPGLTTGSRRITDPGVAAASGAFIFLCWGQPEASLRLLLRAWRLWRGGRFPLFKSLRWLIKGARYIRRHPRSDMA